MVTDPIPSIFFIIAKNNRLWKNFLFIKYGLTRHDTAYGRQMDFAKRGLYIDNK